MRPLTGEEFDRARCLAAQCEADPQLLLACMAELEALRRLQTVVASTHGRPLRIERAINRLPLEAGDVAAWRAAALAGREVYEREQRGARDLLRCG